MKINYPSNEEFYSLPFYVDARVLIPRNDTEVLVDQVLKFIKAINVPNFTFIDIGTWSSAILTAIIKNSSWDFRQAFWLDISQDALDIAKINIEKNNIKDKVSLYNSDLLEVFLSGNQIQDFAHLIITANLPYIKNGDFENMDTEVFENEPHIALFGWVETWFELYERLIWEIFELKNKFHLQNIIVFIEIWFDQYEYSRQYLSHLWLKFEYFKDLNDIWRVIKIEF